MVWRWPFNQPTSKLFHGQGLRRVVVGVRGEAGDKKLTTWSINSVTQLGVFPGGQVLLLLLSGWQCSAKQKGNNMITSYTGFWFQATARSLVKYLETDFWQCFKKLLLVFRFTKPCRRLFVRRYPEIYVHVTHLCNGDWGTCSVSTASGSCASRIASSRSLRSCSIIASLETNTKEPNSAMIVS